MSPRVLEIDRPAVDFPVAEPSRIETTPAADFARLFGGARLGAAFLGFGERTLGGIRERWTLLLRVGLTVGQRMIFSGFGHHSAFMLAILT
ncbi:hypothetical protein RHIZ404_190246 [Rhizobium sp. EC-SD404]|nr:hypothetical protein RHIZ404_190246 [Rhizobium sp. EC-SD404]